MPIHVMAPKEEGQSDDPFEFHCSPDNPWADDDPDVETVFHEQSRLEGDEWYCPCGVNTNETLGYFVTQLVN